MPKIQKFVIFLILLFSKKKKGRNPIDENFLDYVFEILINNLEIQKIDLSVLSFFLFLKKNVSKLISSAGHCSLTDFSASCFAEFLKEDSPLEILHLCFFFLFFSIFCEFLEQFFFFCLKAHNFIGDEGATLLFEAIKNNSSLKELCIGKFISIFGHLRTLFKKKWKTAILVEQDWRKASQMSWDQIRLCSNSQ